MIKNTLLQIKGIADEIFVLKADVQLLLDEEQKQLSSLTESLENVKKKLLYEHIIYKLSNVFLDLDSVAKNLISIQIVELF